MINHPLVRSSGAARGSVRVVIVSKYTTTMELPESARLEQANLADDNRHIPERSLASTPGLHAPCPFPPPSDRRQRPEWRQLEFPAGLGGPRGGASPEPSSMAMKVSPRTEGPYSNFCSWRYYSRLWGFTVTVTALKPSISCELYLFWGYTWDTIVGYYGCFDKALLSVY